ncbi:MAG: SDR family NAD(P)-dependent oxidoreductase [Lewinella sp.]|nr:SDR family NAD(P)-dependent oxidoreductase [Lewinella sp.]
MNSVPTVLITGVSTGIGSAAAELLLASGWRVYGSVRQAGDAVRHARAHPSLFYELVFDLGDSTARKAAVAKIAAAGYPLRALVNNAGIAVNGPLETLTEADVRRQFEVNVFGTLALTQSCLPLLRQAQSLGESPVRIVNISSVSGLLSSPFTSLYSASKFAIESLTDGLRRELMPFGIDAVSVAPGPVKTPIWQKAREQTEAYTETPYSFILEKLPAYLARTEATAIPAAKVAAVIRSVLESKRAPAHQLVMRRAWFYGLLPHLPKRWIDHLVWRNINAGRRY